MILHLDISPQAEARFAAAALRKRMAPAALFEKMVADYLPLVEQGEENQGEFAGRSLADIVQEIGGVEGLPSDMSENPAKYMTGFGETLSARA